jgi:Ca2+-binding RTX toxin-like protein
MATINHSAGADIIVPNNNGTTYRGLGGDDTYILSNSIAANAAITIVDTSGANKIQLVDGLSVASTKFAADAVQLTLSNGAVVTINGASNFTYDLGGNTTAGTTGSVSSFADFASGAGVASLPASGSVAGASNVTVNGTSWSGAAASYSYTISKDASQVSEGSPVTFTVTSSSAVATDTSLTWTAIGSNNGSTVDKATAADLDAQSGSVTIPAGSTSATFSVTPVADGVAEGIEGVQISVFSPESATVGTSTILVNNAGASSTAQTFLGTTGVNNFVGASGDDTFSFTTTGTLNNVDVLDGSTGTDSLSLTNGAGTITPNIENIENLSLTPTASTLTVDLKDTASTFDSIMANTDGGFATTVNNVAEMPGKIGITNGTGALTVNLKAGPVSGTADSINIELAGAGSGSDIAITDDSTTGTLESATINSISSANTLTTLALNGASALTVTGDQSLTLTAALEATVTTVDASAMSGAAGLTMSAEPTAAAITITGSGGVDALVATDTGADNISAGGGNDTITFGGDNEFNVLDTVDGGDGKDTVTHNEDTIVSSQLGGLSNVEVLKSAAASTVTLNSNVGPTEFNLGAGNNDTISFNDDYSQASTVNLYGDANSGDTITNNSDIALTVIATTADLAGGKATSDDSPLTITGSATATDSLFLYASGGDSNMDSNGTASMTNIDDVSFNSLIGVTGAYSTATDFDFGVYSTAITVTNNLGALDGSLTTDFSGGATLGTANYTGGAGVDIVTGSPLNDIITTGAGNDTVTSTGGSNTITTGDGVDIVNMGSGVDIISTGAGNDTIDASAADLLNNDVVDGGDGTDTLTYAATTIADESIFGGVSNVEVIKPLGGNTTAMALTMNGNMGPKIVDASDDSNLTLTLKAGVTDAITVKLGADIGSNDDNVVNTANVDLTVTATDPDSFDSTTGITGGTGTDTITITMVAGGTADISGSTSIDVLNVIDFTTDEVIIVTAGANGSVPLTVNATTQDSGETMDFNGANSTVGVTLNAGAGADSLDGGSGGDTINGNAGIDVIDGQGNSAVTGADNISAGAGNDIITVSTGEAEFSNSSSTALVTDTVDGGAGTDTLAFGDAAATLTKAELANISNIEKLTLFTGSSITLSDDFLTNNPGVSITLVAGTISPGAGTTADPLITLPLNYIAGNGNIKVTGGTADDSFGSANGALINVSDTIDGGAGTDTINLYNDSGFGSAATRAAGESVTLALDIYHTNIEKVVVVDVADEDIAGDVVVTIAAAFTGTAIEIDGSSLDQNALTASDAETLTITQNQADTAAITATGGTGPDIITTGAGADHLTGGAGIDTFSSGAGNDSIYGGAGNDIIDAEAGRDYIEAGDGNDQINIATDSHFEVSGGTETIDGGAGADTLTFTAASAHDISSAELGNVKNIETIEIASTTSTNQTTLGLSDTVLANAGGSITILGNSNGHANSDHKIDGAAVGTGSIRFIPKGNTTAKEDTFIGGAGDDTLQIGFSTASAPTTDGIHLELEDGDVFTGNGGTDVIEYWNVGDNLAANPTEGRGDITATIDFDNITGVEKIVVMDSNGPGTQGTADPITTTIAALTATTTKMPATFEYDGSIIVDTADDQDFNYSSSSAADNDALTTDFTITTGAGDDSVGGSGGDDIITTGGGADSVFGGGRSDTIDGGAGNDELYGGDETALTGVGDSILGGSGDDTIDGDAGADTILGGDGADIITGGTGADIITGGSGADVFLLPTGSAESGGSSIDTITDFTTGSDTIRVTLTAAQMDATGTMAFAATDLGDVSTFAEVESILTGKVGEAVYVTDTNQLVIDYNGDANINSNDIRINLDGTTAYDNADVVYTIAVDNDTARTYTLSDGADIVTASTGSIVDTINGLGGADNIAGGTGADIIDGGAGNDTIDGGATAADVITGGAGNDTITLTAGETDTWTASGVTTAAPYAGINNGSDTVTFLAGAAEGEFDLDPLNNVSGTGGTANWLTVEGNATNALTVNTAADGNIALNTKIIALDVVDANSPTAALMASYIATTTNVGDNYLALTDNGSGIIVKGDKDASTTKLTIWWVDSALDGDGTDVTAADVHLLITSAANLDIDSMHAAQFVV